MRNVKVEVAQAGNGLWHWGEADHPESKAQAARPGWEESGVRSPTRALNIPGSGLILLQVFDSLHQRFCLENLTRTGLDSALPMRNV